MRKTEITVSTPRRASPMPSTKRARKAEIAATLDELNRVEPQSPQAVAVAELLTSWLSDDSGYDEKTWPKLKKALNEERQQVGARRLFDD